MDELFNNYWPENDYRYYLQHHGVQGQKWGQRNAEWYPIADWQSHLKRIDGSEKSFNEHGRILFNRKDKKKQQEDYYRYLSSNLLTKNSNGEVIGKNIADSIEILLKDPHTKKIISDLHDKNAKNAFTHFKHDIVYEQYSYLNELDTELRAQRREDSNKTFNDYQEDDKRFKKEINKCVKDSLGNFSKKPFPSTKINYGDKLTTLIWFGMNRVSKEAKANELSMALFEYSELDGLKRKDIIAQYKKDRAAYDEAYKEYVRFATQNNYHEYAESLKKNLYKNNQIQIDLFNSYAYESPDERERNNKKYKDAVNQINKDLVIYKILEEAYPNEIKQDKNLNNIKKMYSDSPYNSSFKHYIHTDEERIIARKVKEDGYDSLTKTEKVIYDEAYGGKGD